MEGDECVVCGASVHARRILDARYRFEHRIQEVLQYATLEASRLHGFPFSTLERVRISVRQDAERNNSDGCLHVGYAFNRSRNVFFDTVWNEVRAKIQLHQQSPYDCGSLLYLLHCQGC